MSKFEKVIEIFLNKMGYLTNENIEGAIFYGSCATGYNTASSDIDLLIIRNNHSADLYRGIDLVEGYKIEYFERPLSDIYTRADKDFKSQSNVLLSMIGHGVVLFDKNGEIEALQKYILELYSKPLIGMPLEKAKEDVAIMNNRISDLTDLFTQNDPYFPVLFDLTLDKIHKFYHRLYGYPELSTSKVYKIYTDSTGYRERIFKNIPDQQFVDLFLKCIHETNLADKFATLLELYGYSTRGIDLDPLQHRIKISSRN